MRRCLPVTGMLALVADDLTGATDAAVEFASTGRAVRLLRSLDDGLEVCAAGSVLAYATGVRAAAGDEARERTAIALSTLMGLGCEQAFLKIDSTLRGTVAEQIDGALYAWGRRHPGATAVLCPALPAQGRTVVDGVVYVHGTALADSPAGVDPVTPVRDSRVLHLVPAAVRDATAVGPRGGILAADAETEADLDALAMAVSQRGPGAIAVGSSGLAAAMARASRATVESARTEASIRPGSVVVAVSSLHPVARRQAAHLRRAVAAGRHENVSLLVTPEAYTDSVAAADSFAAEVTQLLAGAGESTLVIVGGDGAEAVLTASGARALDVHRCVLPGVPLTTIVGGTLDGTRLITKSGGFGDDDSLVAIIDRLRPGLEPEKETS